MGCCSDTTGGTKDQNHRVWFPVRYQLALTSSVGFMIAYMVRFNLSVAMVAMVNTTQSSDSNTTSDDCPGPANSSGSTKQIVGEFDWSPELQGTILSSFFYGYAVTQLPGGWLAGRFGGKWLVGGSILGISILTLLTPLAARLDVGFLLVVRITMGLLGGVMFPAMHAMLGKWSPVFERSKLAAITYAGSNMGVVIAFPLTGVLCQYGFDGGWPSVFYVMGAAGCLWFLVWCFVASNTPADHPRISQVERDLINQSIGRLVSKQTMTIPWRAIFTSGPIWAILVAGTCCTWGYYTLLTGLPSYLKDVLKLDISQNGILSGIPYLSLFVSYMGSGFLADYIRSRGYLNTTRTRKLMVIIGSVGTVSGFVAISFVGCDHTAVISLVAACVAMGGFYGASTDVNNIDLAPNYAGVLMGITNTVQNFAGILTPLLVGVLIDKQQNRVTWGRVFYIAAGIYAFGMLFYCVFGSGAIQPWGTPPGVQQTVNYVQPGERTPLINEDKTSIPDKKSLET